MDIFNEIKDNIFIWSILGLAAGVIAKYLMPGKDKGGLISTILLGVVGSFLGGFVGNYFGIGGQTLSAGLNMSSALTAVAGAFLLLLFMKILRLLI